MEVTFPMPCIARFVQTTSKDPECALVTGESRIIEIEVCRANSEYLWSLFFRWLPDEVPIGKFGRLNGNHVVDLNLSPY